MLKTLMVKSTLILLAWSISFAAHAVADTRIRVDVPAGELLTALQLLGKQADIEFVYQAKSVKGFHTKGVTGTLTAEEAVTKLLEGTLLTFRKDSSGAMLIAPPRLSTSSLGEREGPAEREGEGNPSPGTGESATAQLGVRDEMKGAGSSPGTGEKGANDNGKVREGESQELPAPEDQSSKAIPEILVRGSRLLNMDIKRSRDDSQPYVILEREQIERSGATNIEDFLKQRLPMNTQGATAVQSGTGSSLIALGNMSQINLRGLGSNQTLILVDGRRLSNAFGVNGPVQSDLNGIPLSAVERIEVLPSTASGIYGGSATGGVVNVILRRDYDRVESRLSFENTFDTDATVRRADVSAGFNLEQGKTNVLLVGSWSDAADLAVQDRDFISQARAAILVNNPGAILPLTAPFPSPPLGATPNIRSSNGSPLFGPGTPNFTSVPVGYAGGGGIAALQANAGRYNLDLADSAQTNGKRQSLVGSPRLESLTATVRREFGANVHSFLDLAASNSTTTYAGIGSSVFGVFTIPANTPNNPFNQSIVMSVPTNGLDATFRSTDYERRAVAGVIVKLPHAWRLETDYLWNRTRYSFEQGFIPTGAEIAAVANGTLNVLRDTIAFPVNFAPYLNPLNRSLPVHSTIKDATLRLAGPVGMLPAGAPTVSASFEHRDEQFDDFVQYARVPPPPCTAFCTRFFPSRSQTVDSAYLEARLPLVSARNALPMVRELELQLAGRWDDYSVVGAANINILTADLVPTTPIARVTNRSSAVSPTFGLRYRPVDAVMLRASFGKGFLPPSIVQLSPTSSQQTGGAFTDPRRGNEPLGMWEQIGGGSPELRPEKSESRSAGVVFTPDFLPGARLSMDWTRIDKSDNIAVPFSSIQVFIDNESLLPGRITRGPPSGGFPVGPITIVDLSLANFAQAQVEAYDLQLDYALDTSAFGAFDFFTVATWQTHYKTQLFANLPLVENVGIGNRNPVEFKANAGVTWKIRGWTLGWSARYFDAYLAADPSLTASATVIRNQGNGGRIPSQVYHDFYAGYRFAGSAVSAPGVASRLLANTEVSLGIKNVFNREPPFDAAVLNYSPFGDARLASYHLTVKHGF